MGAVPRTWKKFLEIRWFNEGSIGKMKKVLSKCVVLLLFAWCGMKEMPIYLRNEVVKFPSYEKKINKLLQIGLSYINYTRVPCTCDACAIRIKIIYRKSV